MNRLIAIALSVYAVVFLTDAVEVTDEDINSPLVSYLLAKLQRLESKMMMVGPNSRSAREEPEEIIDTEADAKQHIYKPRGVTYIRWGNSTCPYGADTIYCGVVAGSFYTHEGAAVDPLCLPHDPQYLKF